MITQVQVRTRLSSARGFGPQNSGAVFGLPNHHRFAHARILSGRPMLALLPAGASVALRRRATCPLILGGRAS